MGNKFQNILESKGNFQLRIIKDRTQGSPMEIDAIIKTVHDINNHQ